MSQSTYTIGSGETGTGYRGKDNSGKQALASFHKGSSAPSYALSGMIYCDDSGDPTWIYKQYDGTDWNEILRINISTGVVTFPNVMTVNGATTYAADGGSNDTYAVTLNPAPTAYSAGMFIFFKANTANTGACTLNVNSLGAKTIKKKKAGALSDLNDNDISAGDICLVVYDGTYFQLSSMTNLDYIIHNASEETTFAVDDFLLFADTSDSNKIKKITKANAAAALGSGLPYNYTASAPFEYLTASTFSVANIRSRNLNNDGDIIKDTSTTVNTATNGLNGFAQSGNQTGTISCSGTTVTGTGTSFTSVFQVGDVIWSSTNNTGRKITAIASNTSLTVSDSWTISSGTNFKRGGLAPNCWYYVYEVDNGSAPGMILSTRSILKLGHTLVDLPSGYTRYYQQRYNKRTDGSSNIIQDFVFDGWPFNPRIHYLVLMPQYGATVGPTNILDGGTNSNGYGSYADLTKCADFTPPNAQRTILKVDGFGNSFSIYLKPKGFSGDYIIRTSFGTNDGIKENVELPTDANQLVQFKTTSGDGVDIAVFGYVM